MIGNSSDCQIAILGAGPYGLAAAAYLRAAGAEVRVFGKPMAFWNDQMPKGMCLRSNWGASHIADPRKELTLDAYCRESGINISKPIPLNCFVDYGRWFQRRAVSDLDQRSIRAVDPEGRAFRITLSDGETFLARRVVVAAGIRPFAARPREFDQIPPALASHSSEHNDLGRFKHQRVVVIGSGQSALESAVLLREAEAEVEVIARRECLTWVGDHPRLHHLGLISKLLYSNRDVGPAGISRLVAAPRLFSAFPRWFQDPVAYRSIRPAVAAWLRPRMMGLPIAFSCGVASAAVSGSQLLLKLDNGTERLVDHAILATGFRVDIARYKFLSPSLLNQVKQVDGYPVLRRGLECSVPGLHIVGKPAAWSFGPIVGFVSGTEFAANELARFVRRSNGRNGAGH